MSLEKSSQTAEAALALRAFGTNSKDTNLIHDPFAERLIRGIYAFLGGSRFRRWLFVEQLYNRLMPGMIGVPLIRMRYTEDKLAECIKPGDTYIILGAGMNSFAWRNDGYRVLEVDHPLTQTAKTERYQESELAMPEHLDYLAIDFATTALAEALKPKIKTGTNYFVSWNGVTYYLSEADTRQTLTDLSACLPSGTTIVLDFMDSAAFEPEKQDAVMKRIFRAVERRGEPFQTGFTKDSMIALLDSCGFTVSEILTGTEIAEHYKNDVGKYPPFPFIHYLSAKVK